VTDTPDTLQDALREHGYVAMAGSDVQAWLGSAWTGWSAFADSWDDLPEDPHMADGGRYRRRRYGVFEIVRGEVRRSSHQPHYQSKTYNRLNGGVARWFEPISSAIGAHPILLALIAQIGTLFEAARTDQARFGRWHVEVHQFRIEASATGQGHPTPEGAHRDGVDFAFVMMVRRRNVASGVTQISDALGNALGAFTLAQPGDAVFLDDHRIFHGVTPIEALDPAKLAVRDVLVITFTRTDGAAEAVR